MLLAGYEVVQRMENNSVAAWTQRSQGETQNFLMDLLKSRLLLYPLQRIVLVSSQHCIHVASLCVCGLDESGSLLFYIGRMSEPCSFCGRPVQAQCSSGKKTLDKLSLRRWVCLSFGSYAWIWIFVLSYTEDDANEDILKRYSWADVCALTRLGAAHCGVVIH